MACWVFSEIPQTLHQLVDFLYLYVWSLSLNYLLFVNLHIPNRKTLFYVKIIRTNTNKRIPLSDFVRVMNIHISSNLLAKHTLAYNIIVKIYLLSFGIPYNWHRERACTWLFEYWANCLFSFVRVLFLLFFKFRKGWRFSSHRIQQSVQINIKVTWIKFSAVL